MVTKEQLNRDIVELETKIKGDIDSLEMTADELDSIIGSRRNGKILKTISEAFATRIKSLRESHQVLWLKLAALRRVIGLGRSGGLL